MRIRKSLFFNLILVFSIAFFGCEADNSSEQVKYSQSVSSFTPDVPEDGSNDNQSEVTMKAVLLYDGSLKSLNSDNSLSVICDAETIVKVGDQWIINDELKDTIDGEAVDTLTVKAVKACIYGDVLWYYGSDGNIYRDGTKIGTNPKGYSIVLNDDGVACGFTFYRPDGSLTVADSEFGFILSNKIVGMRTSGTSKVKKIFDGDEWKTISSSLYTNFFKFDALITDSRVIWPSGATLNIDTMIASEPTYNSALASYTGGNAFVTYFEKYTEQRWQPIGHIDNIGYFFRPKNGKIYKYDIENDILTEWIQIVSGTGSSKIAINNALIETTGAIIAGTEIIYFDGSSIYRMDVTTGEKNEIAEATELKAIAI